MFKDGSDVAQVLRGQRSGIFGRCGDRFTIARVPLGPVLNRST